MGGRVKKTESKLQAFSLLATPDGDTEILLYFLSSIQPGFLSVICSKCLHHTYRDWEIITGCRPARLLIGSIGPYQLRIFEDLWQIPIRKSLFTCQFKRLLKQLIFVLIGTSSPPHLTKTTLARGTLLTSRYFATVCRSIQQVRAVTGIQIKRANMRI